MPRVKVILNLSERTISVLEELKAEYGVSSRAKVIEVLIDELINPEASEDQATKNS